MACTHALPCPPFLPEEAAGLTIIRNGPALRPLAPPSRQTRSWDLESDGWVLRYSNPDGEFLEFRIAADGAAITVNHHGPYSWVQHLMILLGPALAAALHLRGVPVLHGAAVHVGGGAAVFVGHAESGKSSLTAALVSAGQPLLCEELVALGMDHEPVAVLPGHALIKISPQAAQSLGHDPTSLPLVFPEQQWTDELWLDAREVSGGLHPTPSPIRLVYVLAGRRSGIKTPIITPLSPSAATLALVPHFYGKNWFRIEPGKILSISTRIVANASIRQIWLPEGLEHIWDCVEAILEDVSRVQATVSRAPSCSPET